MTIHGHVYIDMNRNISHDLAETEKFVSLYQRPLHKITLFTVARGLYKSNYRTFSFNTPFFQLRTHELSLCVKQTFL